MLFERIGYKYRVGKFNAIFNRAKQIQNGGDIRNDDVASVRAFMQAVQEMHDID